MARRRFRAAGGLHGGSRRDALAERRAAQPRDAWRGLTAIIGHWQLRGYGLWAVERKSDRAFIGRVGLNNPEGWPGLEIGWTLGKQYWGAGYASEAARAVMSYGFLTQPVERLISVIHVDNKPSQAVAQRVGETKGEQYDICYRRKDVSHGTLADFARGLDAAARREKAAVGDA